MRRIRQVRTVGCIVNTRAKGCFCLWAFVLRMKIHSRLESFLFSEGRPPSLSRESKLIEFIPAWDMVNLFMMMEKRNPLAPTARHIGPAVTLHYRRSIPFHETQLTTRGDAKTHLKERDTLLSKPFLFYLA